MSLIQLDSDKEPELIECGPVPGFSFIVYLWKCAGWIDGEQAPEFLLRTRSTKQAEYVGPGWEGDCDYVQKDKAYFIPKPGQGNQPWGKDMGIEKREWGVETSTPAPKGKAAPPPRKGRGAPAKAAAPPRKAPVAKPKRTWDDIHGICRQSLLSGAELAKDMLPNEATNEDVRALAVTMFIQGCMDDVVLDREPWEDEDENPL